LIRVVLRQRTYRPSYAIVQILNRAVAPTTARMQPGMRGCDAEASRKFYKNAFKSPHVSGFFAAFSPIIKTNQQDLI